jgi:hypothetical protein
MGELGLLGATVPSKKAFLFSVFLPFLLSNLINYKKLKMEELDWVILSIVS